MSPNLEILELWDLANSQGEESLLLRRAESPLDDFIGRCALVEIALSSESKTGEHRPLPDIEPEELQIAIGKLEREESLPEREYSLSVERLLIRAGAQGEAGDKRPRYLSLECLAYLGKIGVKLVGVENPSLLRHEVENDRNIADGKDAEFNTLMTLNLQGIPESSLYTLFAPPLQSDTICGTSPVRPILARIG